MSGHSHAANVKRKKEAAASKRSQTFGKLAKEITIAAKSNGDPETNPRLRTAIEKAREVNMPSDNIERAIKRGTGEEAGQLEELILEGYGPGGIAIVLECITDNRNRTLGEVKQIFLKHQGKLAGEGAVQWMFERKGVLTVLTPEPLDEPKKEALSLTAIESGAEDLYWQHDNSALDIYTTADTLAATKEALEQKGITVESATLDWVPKERVSVSEKEQATAERLFEALDDDDSVQEIYSNLEV